MFAPRNPQAHVLSTLQRSGSPLAAVVAHPARDERESGRRSISDDALKIVREAPDFA
jgi:hypothetical protein